ncbi:MAG: flagellar hook-basal body complex protein FliE [Alphaproteobacteria bacterium]|nr:flagellar hook-basal body complex protein FliE [Pseudomonadota bacterium]MCZ6467957.1 flagellar hook-basal body complex protein FliE [Alphaproteobacteria bacterium]MCZ6608192.1 flagellar hook-basal body complex protein FliE [Alphaproteobacteria bacterium]
MPSAAENITSALAAYAKAAKGGGPGIDARDSAPGDDFADLVKGAIRHAVKLGEESERLSVAGITGQAALSQVVTAVAEAEVALQTVVAVRDKVIDAYREILRMPM